MDTAITIIMGTVAIFLAMFTLVALSPKVSRIVLAGAAVTAVLGGLICYGLCFHSLYDNSLLAMLNTGFTVLCLFLGEDIPEILLDAPLMQLVTVQLISSVLRFLAIFATAGAAISAVGAKLLRSIRLFLQRGKKLAVIHPLNANTLEFARELIESGEYVTVFADENPDTSCAETAAELGCVVRSDTGAMTASEGFLRSIGASRGKRKICLFAISSDRFANREYANRFLDSLKARNVAAKQTSLTIFAEEDETQNAFASGEYTYGTVLSVNEEYMAARQLMMMAPPYETIRFDENGRATEDFRALVIGSGNVGQAVIKQLVMNGQFAGSKFLLTVFDPAFDSITGRIRYECQRLFKEYKIEICDADARSDRMYAYLSANWDTLKYIVVCTGDDSSNREICRQLLHFLGMHGSKLPLYICSRRGLQRITAEAAERKDIFTADILCTEEIDRRAMILNDCYCGDNGKTKEENWADCDYFSRMSSRASADYAPAFLKMAGKTLEELTEEGWYTPAQMENMAISEHERWCAFHYCMGFRPMTREEFEGRCETYRQEKAKNPNTRYRIGKDLTARIHCCLIPWEDLPDLSSREKAVTGKLSLDYQEMDRDNVRMLPKIMKPTKE